MIKVYLDWNCITHSKDKFSELKDLLKRYNGIYICPYSVAHLRDVQTKSNANPLEYERDLDSLTEICGTHMLLLENGAMKLLNAAPREYLKDSGEIIDYIQNKFIFPYSQIRELVQSTIPKKIHHRISVENSPEQVIPLINGIIKSSISNDDDLDTLLERARPTMQEKLEERIRTVYYALDILGYKQESKNKSIANIDTDVQHIAVASLCDYLITDDKKMRDKAHSIYSHIGCATVIKDPLSFSKEIASIAEHCYDDDLIPMAMQTHGTPSVQEDGAHVKALDYPLWGVFKFCYNAISFDSTASPNRAIFLPDRFMFYDELRPLGNITSLFVPETQRQIQVENYIQSYVQSKHIGNFAFMLNSQKYQYDCLLTTSDGLPALRVEYTQKDL